MKKPIIACAVQQPCNRGRATNLAYSIAQIEQAAKQHADLVVLPELHLDHYFCQSEDTNCFDLAQSIPGPTCETLSQAAKAKRSSSSRPFSKTRASCIQHRRDSINTAHAGTFARCIFRTIRFYEKFYFTPGDLASGPSKPRSASSACWICWDQWYPGSRPANGIG